MANTALVRYQVSPGKPGYTANYDVRVRRQNTKTETVKLLEEYSHFTKEHFPHYQTQFYQVPEVFTQKVKDAKKVVEGFPSLPAQDPQDPQHKVWKTHRLGDQAEYAVHQAIHRELQDRPAFSWNSFEIKKLFFVVKESLKEDRDLARQKNPNVLEHPLVQGELTLFYALGHDVNNLKETVACIIQNLYDSNPQNPLESNLKKILKSPLADNKDVEVSVKLLLRKIQNPNNPLNPEKTEVENFLKFTLWNRMMDKNQEFDQFVLDKLSSLFLHLEVKSVVREEGKYKDKGLKGEFHEACSQLEAGRNMFMNTVAPACNLSQNWAYQGRALQIIKIK